MAILLKEENSIVPRLFSVIFGLVPKILMQQVINLVKKFAILLHKYRFRQDCRNKSGNDGCWGCLLSVCCSVFNASTLSVILRRERSELSGESRNITSIFMNRIYHSGHSANSLRSKPRMTIKNGVRLNFAIVSSAVYA